MKRDFLPYIHCLKASAGTGKTHSLTREFISLLNGFSPFPGKKEALNILRQIVAITFTNKAAAEMKERIIYTLKENALKKTGAGDIHIEPKLADKWLELILSNFENFHVRTIDSLVYALLKALALELGLNPDIEITFQEQEVVNFCFDKIVALANWSDPEDKTVELLSELLDSFLRIERLKGFNPEGKIRKRIFELFSKIEGNLKTTQDQIGGKLDF